MSSLQSLANRLGVMLNAEGEKESKAWHQLRERLVELATIFNTADPQKIKSELNNKAEVIGSLDLDHPDAQHVLRQIMKAFVGEVDASKSILQLKDFIVLVASALNMVPLCNSEHAPMIQVIQEEEKKDVVIFYEDNVNYVLSSMLVADQNAPYGVVSIVGAQSSGKSFLLNKLFGTNFPVMNKEEGWSQTTRGVLMSRCIGPSLLIMDVEGFDGREHGEDRTFENQAALFALTISDVMIVNIAERDIGRNLGGGQMLFKTIFQERTGLPPALTKILVVIRFCDMKTSAEVLRKDVIGNLKKIWESVHVKQKKAATKFEDYIEVTVVPLPEMDKPDFHTKVKELRNLLSKSSLHHDHRSAKVPASSFSLSSKMLWDEIMQNKRLDLPSHKAAIATIYCQKIVEETLNSLLDSQKELFQTKNSPEGFKELAHALLKSTIEKYDQETLMYDEDVRTKERKNMVDKINESFSKYARIFLQQIRKDMSGQLKNVIAAKLKSMDETGAVNYDVVGIVDEYKTEFINMCQELKEFDFEYFFSTCEDLQKELYSYTNYQMLGIKEERAKREMALAAERNDKNIDELRKIVEAAMKERDIAAEEIKRHKDMLDREYQRSKESMEAMQLLLKHDRGLVLKCPLM